MSRVERSLVTASVVLQIIYPAFLGGTNGVSPGTSLLYDVSLVFSFLTFKGLSAMIFSPGRY